MNSIGISIGWNCYSAIKGVDMGIRNIRSEGYKTCPFDEAITNYTGIVQCIKDDFKYFLDLDYIELFKVSEECPYCTGDILIRNTKYNFVFNHESPGHANLWQIQGWAGGKDHFISNSFYNFKERYSMRIENFRNYLTSGNEIVFLLTRSYPSETLELDNVLRDKYPNLLYRVVYLDLQLGSEHYKKHLSQIMGLPDTDMEIIRIK